MAREIEIRTNNQNANLEYSSNQPAFNKKEFLNQKHVKKLAPLAFFNEEPKQSESDALLGNHIDALFQEFQTSVSMMKPHPNLQLDGRSVNQLKPFISELMKLIEEQKQIITYTRQRMSVCRQHPGYLEELKRILTNSQDTFNELSIKIDTLYNQILDKAQLLAPVKFEHKHLLEAKNDLIASLDYFLLSFGVIDLTDRTNPNTVFFVKELSAFTKELTASLNNTNLGLNKQAVTQLDMYLRTQLGMKTALERLFHHSENNLITDIQVDVLVTNLFLNTPPLSSESAARDQLVGIYDLSSKIKAFPIANIKNFNTLMVSEKEQNKQIKDKNDETIEYIANITSILQTQLSLFTSTSLSDLSAVKTGRLLLAEFQETQEAFSALINEYSIKCKSINQIQSPLNRLAEITSLQQTTLKTIDNLHQKSQQLHAAAESITQNLEQVYESERSLLIIKMHDTLNQAKCALRVQKTPRYAEDLISIEELLRGLSDKKKRPTLFTLKSKISIAVDTLTGYIQEVKNELKTKWGKAIIHHFTIEDEASINDLSFTQTVLLLKEHILPYPHSSLHPINPFQNELHDLTEQTNQDQHALLTTYATLNTASGSEFKDWSNSINNRFNDLFDSAEQRSSLEEKALIIEERIQTKAYKTSLLVINNLEKEFVRILNAHIDLVIANGVETDQLTTLKDNPELYFNQIMLSNDSEKVLNSIDLRLVKLFNIRRDFEQLNSRFINKEVDLCSGEHYVKNLFKITLNHLHNNSMEEISKNIGKGASLVFWLRIYVLKPLMQCHSLAKDYVNPLVDYVTHLGRASELTTTRPRFFTPVHRTPFGSKTEKELIQTGQDVLNTLESEYQGTLIAASV